MQEQARETEGKTFAAFVVEFQRLSTAQGEQVHTRVHRFKSDAEEDGESNSWKGLANLELCEWMNNQIDEKYLASEEEESSPEPILEPVVEDEEPVEKSVAVADKQAMIKQTAVTITQVYAYQPPEAARSVGSGKLGQMFKGYLKAEQPFALSLDLEFSLATDNTAIPYHIQGCASNRQTGEITQLQQAEGKTFNGGEKNKSLRLSGITLKSGLYRLQTWVTLQTTSKVLSFMEIPLMQVA